MSAADDARNQIRLIEQACDFLEHSRIQEMADKHVPVTMPRDIGSLGFDIPLWMGLGVVGLWAALDAYAERSGYKGSCPICRRNCLHSRFVSTGRLVGKFGQIVAELEDLRHVFAHNFAGVADALYFSKRRHVLHARKPITLLSGAPFNGEHVCLDVKHLRYYAKQARHLL
jgi:hypothetical protein